MNRRFLARNLVVAGMLGAALILAGWTLAPLLGSFDPIGPANYSRIQLGMTQEEVERIIGLPPGYYYNNPRNDHAPSASRLEERGLSRNGLTEMHPLADPVARDRAPVQDPALIYRSAAEMKTAGDPHKKGSTRQWDGNSYTIEVAFDENGEAVGCYLWEVTPPPAPTLPDRIRAWIGW